MSSSHPAALPVQQRCLPPVPFRAAVLVLQLNQVCSARCVSLPNCLQVEGKGGFSKLMQKVGLELNSVA